MSKYKRRRIATKIQNGLFIVIATGLFIPVCPIIVKEYRHSEYRITEQKIKTFAVMIHNYITPAQKTSN